MLAAVSYNGYPFPESDLEPFGVTIDTSDMWAEDTRGWYLRKRRRFMFKEAVCQRHNETGEGKDICITYEPIHGLMSLTLVQNGVVHSSSLYGIIRLPHNFWPFEVKQVIQDCHATALARMGGECLLFRTQVLDPMQTLGYLDRLTTTFTTVSNWPPNTGITKYIIRVLQDWVETTDSPKSERDEDLLKHWRMLLKKCPEEFLEMTALKTEAAL